MAVKDYICQRYSKSSQEGGGEGLGPFETFPKIHPLSHAKAILMSNLRGPKVTQIVSFLGGKRDRANLAVIGNIANISLYMGGRGRRKGFLEVPRGRG